MMKAKEYIKHLDLSPHPEGGYFKEIYRSDTEKEFIAGKRSLLTSIYFLLEKGQKSHWHKIKSDEQWHFYAGAPLTICIIKENKLEKLSLGPNIKNGESLFINIPADHWFGAFSNGDFTLVGATVAPGFDFQDFSLAKREDIPLKDPLSLSLILDS
ncbi:MAG: cupin domain-containing protein [Bacteriovoracaceae bacterium]